MPEKKRRPCLQKKAGGAESHIESHRPLSRPIGGQWSIIVVSLSTARSVCSARNQLIHPILRLCVAHRPEAWVLLIMLQKFWKVSWSPIVRWWKIIEKVGRCPDRVTQLGDGWPWYVLCNPYLFTTLSFHSIDKTLHHSELCLLYKKTALAFRCRVNNQIHTMGLIMYWWDE